MSKGLDRHMRTHKSLCKKIVFFIFDCLQPTNPSPNSSKTKDKFIYVTTLI